MINEDMLAEGSKFFVRRAGFEIFMFEARVTFGHGCSAAALAPFSDDVCSSVQGARHRPAHAELCLCEVVRAMGFVLGR